MLGDLGNLIFAKGLKKCPKLKKSPNLVTLVGIILTNGQSPFQQFDVLVRNGD